MLKYVHIHRTVNFMNCKYDVSDLKPVFWLVDNENLIFDSESVALEEPERHDCLSVSFSGQSTLDGRYSFDKGITIVMRGYRNDVMFKGHRIAVETRSGELYLIDAEFDLEAVYTYRLGGDNNDTTFNLDFSENLPIVPVKRIIGDSGYNADECEYRLPEIRKITLVPHDKCMVSSAEISLMGTEPIVFDGLVGTTLTESFDGYRYSTTLTFRLPLNADNVVDTYHLQEFMSNRYVVAVEPENLILGMELGLQATENISSEQASVEVVLSSDENINMMEVNKVVFTKNTQVVWKYIDKTSDGQYGYVCRGEQANPDGEALHILQAGYYKNGQSNGEYRVHINYRNGWFHGLNIVGVFTQNVYFYKDSCYAPDTLKIDGIVSPHNFYVIGQQRPIDVDSKFSDWTATTVPSFCTLSLTSGGSGKTRTTLTCTGSTSQQGELVISNDSQSQAFVVIADFSLPIIVPSNEITYQAQVKNYFIRKQVYLVSKSSTSGFDASVAITGKTVRIVFPENGTSGDVTYTFIFSTTSYPRVEQTVVITQHPQ